MRKSNFALRLRPSLLQEARKLAESEGVALNQLINLKSRHCEQKATSRNVLLAPTFQRHLEF